MRVSDRAFLVLCFLAVAALFITGFVLDTDNRPWYEIWSKGIIFLVIWGAVMIGSIILVWKKR